MKAIAIETATEACSVALHIDGTTHELHEIVPREHTKRLLPMAQELLSEAEVSLTDLDFIAFGRGPGAFTGVRIAASAAQGIALGADLPVIPVSTLAILAQGCYEKTNSSTILSCIDARMSEVYWSIYQPNEFGIVELKQDEAVIPPEQVQVLIDIETAAAVGSGFITYKDELSRICNCEISTYLDDIYPHATNLMSLAIEQYKTGKAVSPELALPVYLRDNVAKKSAAKNKGAK